MSIVEFALKPSTRTIISVNPDIRIGSRIGFPVTNFAFGQAKELRDRPYFSDPSQFQAARFTLGALIALTNFYEA